MMQESGENERDPRSGFGVESCTPDFRDKMILNVDLLPKGPYRFLIFSGKAPETCQIPTDYKSIIVDHSIRNIDELLNDAVICLDVKYPAIPEYFRLLAADGVCLLQGTIGGSYLRAVDVVLPLTLLDTETTLHLNFHEMFKRCFLE